MPTPNADHEVRIRCGRRCDDPRHPVVVSPHRPPQGTQRSTSIDAPPYAPPVCPVLSPPAHPTCSARLAAHSAAPLIPQMGFTATSAGGLMAGYVAWVFHPLHKDLFTPVSVRCSTRRSFFQRMAPSQWLFSTLCARRHALPGVAGSSRSRERERKERSGFGHQPLPEPS